MQSQYYSRWIDRLEALKKKCRDSSSRLIAALGEAEVEMHREEILKQIGSQNEGQERTEIEP
jgi:ribosomal protein L20